MKNAIVIGGKGKVGSHLAPMPIWHGRPVHAADAAGAFLAAAEASVPSFGLG